MSGIAGVWHLDGRPAVAADLDCMLDRLAHRGPDGTQRAVRGPLAMGHRLLRTAPDDGAAFAQALGGLLITADLRLDNRSELTTELGWRHESHAVPDARLVLAAYERWGERCVEHLLGDFAFALWDERQGQLFCARDHLGVRPFYYYHGPGRLFAFASEIKGLLALGDVPPPRLNEVRVADYLVRVFDDKAGTFYENVLRLPPAHTLVLSRDGIRLREYWRLDPTREIRLANDAAYAEAFRDIFTEAVRCRVRGVNPPPGFLRSGGIDSS
jgi:asparagine synthase (glutamine-hydrolysing)